MGAVGDVMDGIQGVVSMFGKADAINDVIDIGASILGLPPELKDAVKIGAGVLTGDLDLVVQGGVGLATDVVHDIENAHTEYCPPRESNGRCDGYASPHQAGPHHASSNEPHAPHGSSGTHGSHGQSALDPDVYRYRDSLQVLQANFSTFDAAGRSDGNISRDDLNRVAKDPHASPTLKNAANFILQHPEYEKRLEHSIPLFGMDGHIGKSQLALELQNTNKQIATYGNTTIGGTEGHHGAHPAGGHGGTPPPGHAVATGSGGSTRSAGSAEGFTPDFGHTSSPPPSSSSAGGNSLKAILSDPSMSLEDKIDALCSQMMKSIDGQIEDVMGQMADLQDQDDAASKKMTDSAGSTSSSGKKTGAQAQTQHQELQRNMEQLQQQLQKLMERRNQMFTLQTNMSEKFNEMAKQALQNLGRA